MCPPALDGMRVAVVAAVTSQHRESERRWRTRRTAELLAGRGHEVVVCCARWWGRTPEFVDEESGVRYRAVAPTPGHPGFAARVGRTVQAVDPDVVHAVHDHPKNVLGAKAGAIVSRAPLVLDWYDTEVPRPDSGALGGIVTPARRWLAARAARAPTTVLTPSRTIRTHVWELGAEDDVRVVPNGIEFERIRNVDPDGTADIVVSGRLDGTANVESLLLALAEFRERDWEATVVGDGPARPAYERQASDLRIDDRVTFAGALDLEERLALFRAAHVYVHTATSTPFATDLLRALACGCVGIVEYHAESSAHELVEQRARGFLVTSEEELVDALGAAGQLDHRTVEEDFAEFDEREVVRQYVDCYRDAGAVSESL
jgi:glycosyltransferase involved in cell wall biosynthesis